MAYATGISLSLVLIVSIIMAAHYLQQIRDVLRLIHETQKKLAARSGVRL